jgi:hypothetical protein
VLDRVQSSSPGKDEYFPDFKSLTEICPDLKTKREADTVQVKASFIKLLIEEVVSRIYFDDDYYYRNNPDVAEALRTGKVTSLQEHFIHTGYFEGRRPSPLYVDSAWYVSNYPDIAEALARGEVASATRHFEDRGLQEGRAGSSRQLEDMRRWSEIAGDARVGR